jgi:hypothetical protein
MTEHHEQAAVVWVVEQDDGPPLEPSWGAVAVFDSPGRAKKYAKKREKKYRGEPCRVVYFVVNGPDNE